MPAIAFRIDWSVFMGSSHCEDGIVEFADGELKTYNAWYKWHLPLMLYQGKYVRTIKRHLSVNEARKRARRKATREGWM